MRDISYYYRGWEGDRMPASARHEPGPSLENGASARQPARQASSVARIWLPWQSQSPTRRWPRRRLPSLVRRWPRRQSPASAQRGPLRSSPTASLPPPGPAPRGGADRASATYAEHRRRTVAAVVLVYALAQANLGLAWDIRWHGAVG